MKVCIIQPFYSEKYEDAGACFADMLRLMDECDDTLDLIVLPEYCDIPVKTPDAEAFRRCIEEFRPILSRKIPALAKRCGALVFANYASPTENGYKNTTHAFDRSGREIGRYDKAHPAPSETKTAEQGGNGLDCAYSYSYAKPYILEAEGLRIGFLTCYDFYMYEEFPQIARENVDIVVGCSHQRTDTHHALEVIGEFLAYNTNAYLIRSAVSMGADSPVCGCSMVVSPKGEMLLNMKNDVGLGVCEIDVNEKYLKPAGYLGALRSHHDYIEEGRRPWLYRPAGSMMIPSDDLLPYPRICAHRGFNTVAPENSMPAFGAAIALGAEEIEFDLWSTKDGELVSIHDCDLERVSDGTGKVWDYTYDELLRFDFGKKCGDAFAGLRIVRFEEILRKFACTVIMNIHVKIWDVDSMDHQYRRISDLLHQYDCHKHCYMMGSTDRSFAEFRRIAPDVNLCVGWDGNKTDMLSMVDRAVALGAEKIQLFKPYFDQTTVDAAKAHGIRTNVFYADDPEEARRYAEMGIDCILTNDYLRIRNALKK